MSSKNAIVEKAESSAAADVAELNPEVQLEVDGEHGEHGEDGEGEEEDSFDATHTLVCIQYWYRCWCFSAHCRHWRGHGCAP
jgi:hypothetical protein